MRVSGPVAFACTKKASRAVKNRVLRQGCRGSHLQGAQRPDRRGAINDQNLALHENPACTKKLAPLGRSALK